MALYGQSIDPTDTTGPGRAIEPDHAQTASRVTLIVDVQDPDGLHFTMALEGSVDGVNWRQEFTMVYPDQASALGPTPPFPVVGGNAAKAYRAFRANLVSFSISPGGSGTVSAAISILPP